MLSGKPKRIDNKNLISSMTMPGVMTLEEQKLREGKQNNPPVYQVMGCCATEIRPRSTRGAVCMERSLKKNLVRAEQ